MEEIESLFGSGMINHLISQLLAMGITILLIPRLWITSIFGAIGILVSISIFNAFLWDAALFFAIPQSFTSTAIQLFLANGLLFWILVKFLPGIEIEGILPAIVAPVVFSIISKILHTYAGAVDWIDLIYKGLEFISHQKSEFQNKSSNV